MIFAKDKLRWGHKHDRGMKILFFMDQEECFGCSAVKKLNEK